MWPILLDMTKEESLQQLRGLEIEAFASLVNALRAQGALSKDKLTLLRTTGSMLHIPLDRHKAEIRRVVNDERLNTIAYHVNGERNSSDEWTDEGKRMIPLMQRVAPQTAYSAIADEVADTASKVNKQPPLSTERCRPLTPPNESSIRPLETDAKKRKAALPMDCSLGIMPPPKISRIQQIYRQNSRNRMKDQLGLLRDSKLDGNDANVSQLLVPGTSSLVKPPSSAPITSKINILQNICMKPATTTNEPISRFRTTSTPDRRTNLTPKTTITTTDGHKLIVVSTISTTTPKQSITTVPFKALESFKIVNLMNVNPTMPKMVAMRSVTASNKVLPISQVQVLNTKSGIIVLPISSKMVTTRATPCDTTKSTCSIPSPMVCTKPMDRVRPRLLRHHARVPFISKSNVVIDCDADDETHSNENGERREEENAKQNGLFNVDQIVAQDGVLNEELSDDRQFDAEKIEANEISNKQENNDILEQLQDGGLECINDHH